MTTPLPELTDRHRQIVKARCDYDMTNDQVGAALGISGLTVKNHITIILKKLDCNSMVGVCTRWGRATANDPTGVRPDGEAIRSDEI